MSSLKDRIMRYSKEKFSAEVCFVVFVSNVCDHVVVLILR